MYLAAISNYQAAEREAEDERMRQRGGKQATVVRRDTAPVSAKKMTGAEYMQRPLPGSR